MGIFKTDPRKLLAQIQAEKEEHLARARFLEEKEKAIRLLVKDEQGEDQQQVDLFTVPHSSENGSRGNADRSFLRSVLADDQLHDVTDFHERAVEQNYPLENKRRTHFLLVNMKRTGEVEKTPEGWKLVD